MLRGSTTSERFGDAGAGAAEVEAGRGMRGGEAAGGALLGGLEAFFDGVELAFEAVRTGGQYLALTDLDRGGVELETGV